MSNNGLMKSISLIVSFVVVMSLFAGIDLCAYADSGLYTITFDGNGSTGGSTANMKVSKSSNSFVVPDSGFIKQGYHFVGWSPDFNPMGTIVQPGQVIDKANYSMLFFSGDTTTFHAQWEEGEEETYSFVFDGNGATSGSTNSIIGIRRMSNITMPNNGFTREGYTFRCWNTRRDGTGLSVNPGRVVSGQEIQTFIPNPSEIKWYAIWRNNNESDNVMSIDYASGKAVVKDDVSGGNATVPVVYTTQGKVYRMYDPGRGEHFYTKNAAEMQQLVSLGWHHEANADFIVVDAKDVNAIPVYRLYNPNGGGMHFYTENAAEAKHLRSVGWNYEGISHYVYVKNANKGVAQYRLYNPNSTNGEHNWTTDVGEWTMLRNAGWKDEGVCWKLV